MINTKKGFTLVELLIVIGILAILTAAVVVILNPAELLRQARDSQRFSDLDSINSALSLYLADASTPDLTTATHTTCHALGTSGPNCGARFTVATTASSSASTTRATDKTGWLPVGFSEITGGSPLAILPMDPSHGLTYFYAYAGNDSTLTFELNANLESTKYTSKESNDGGNSASFYEIGNDPGLDM